MFLIPFYAQLEEMRVTEWSDNERPIMIKKGTNQLVRPSLVTWEIPVTPWIRRHVRVVAAPFLSPQEIRSRREYKVHQRVGYNLKVFPHQPIKQSFDCTWYVRV